MTKKTLSNAIFKKAVQSISKEHKRLNHDCSWVFLNTPARTLNPSTRLFFLALNPAIICTDLPKKSDESGNSYRTENWGADKKKPMQTQVELFYKWVAEKTGHEWEKLMDDSLASNFCPFGSPSWKEFTNKRSESMNFSTDLWKGILNMCAPSVIVCLGQIPYDEIYDVLSSENGLGFCCEKSESLRTGWGNITYTTSILSRRNRKILLVRLPHLSRFGIFRDSHRNYLQPLIMKVAKFLK